MGMKYVLVKEQVKEQMTRFPQDLGISQSQTIAMSVLLFLPQGVNDALLCKLL